MSEQHPEMPQDLQQFAALEAKNFKNGANHVYGVDAVGKKTHIKGDDVLAAYGYDDVQTELDREANQLPQVPENSPRDELIDEYAEALKKGETDLSLNEWVLGQERKKQAKWHTNTKVHGEYDEAKDTRAKEIQDRLDELTQKDLSGGLSEDESQEMNVLIEQLNGLEDGQDNADRKLQEKLKGAPSEDDVDYYRWLKNKSGKGEKSPDGSEDKTEEVPVINPEIPLPEAMGTRLTDARERYCRLAASREGKLSWRDKKELKEAEQEYREALAEAGGWIANEIQNNPEYQDRFANTLQELATMGAVLEIHEQTGRIREFKEEAAESKQLKWFYNMWAGWGGRVIERDEQGGWHFNVKNLINRGKKLATMTVVGLPMAALASVAGVTAAGPIGGGLVAGALAIRLGKSLFGAKVGKEAAATATVAKAQEKSRVDSQVGNVVKKALSADEEWTPTVEDVVGANTDAAEAGVDRNRKRFGTAAAAGVIGGIAAAELFDGGGGGGDKVLHAKAKPFDIDLETPTFKPNVPHDLIGDGRYPWDVWTELTDGVNGTPKIEQLVAKAEGLGIHFQGNGQGGGVGAIEWVKLPDGTTYTDNAHINAYLDYVNTH